VQNPHFKTETKFIFHVTFPVNEKNCTLRCTCGKTTTKSLILNSYKNISFNIILFREIKIEQREIDGIAAEFFFLSNEY